MSLIDHAPPVAELDADDGKPLRSIEKGLAILDAFEGDSALLGVSEIARRSGLPKSTAFRLTTSLEQKGYLERVGDRYRLGLRLFELGNMVSWCRPRRLRETALPFMCDLFRQTGKTVHLAVLDGTDALYLERIHGHKAVNPASRVGGRLPAYCTGVGKALLAYNPESAMRVMAQPLVPRTPYTITSHQVLAEELVRIRQTGIAYDREENSLGITCVAAPILLDDRAIGAVSVTCAPATDVERYVPAVRAAALGIRRSIDRTPGLRPAPPRTAAPRTTPPRPAPARTARQEQP